MLKNLFYLIRNREVFAVGFLFAVTSLLFGIWVAAVPQIKAQFQLSESGLGLSLLLAPLGAITGMLLSGRIFSRIPVGNWMWGGYSVICLLMIAQLHANNLVLWWITLYIYGMVSFLNGVSANTTVGTLERRHGRLLMSTCHAMYSMGGALSGLLAGALYRWGYTSREQILMMGFFLLLMMQWNRKWLIREQDIIHSKSAIRFPSAKVLSLSFICLVTFMSEGCVADWSALYLRDTLQAPAFWVPIGYSGFALLMTLGRLNGDTWTQRFGRKTLVVTGSLVAALGFLLVAIMPMTSGVIAGFMGIGAGCSCIVPVLFSESGHIPGVSRLEGYSMVTTGGLIGFLAGPSIIGFIAEAAGLSRGFLLMTLLAATAALIGYRYPFGTPVLKTAG